jgi:CheY-like chemotaxis protein
VVLEGYGLTIDEAENGLMALEMATDTDYDLILMDVQMPKMDGLTATKELRSRGVKTPIIALTANAMKGFEQELSNAGYTDYLGKPIDLELTWIFSFPHWLRFFMRTQQKSPSLTQARQERLNQHLPRLKILRPLLPGWVRTIPNLPM